MIIKKKAFNINGNIKNKGKYRILISHSTNEVWPLIYRSISDPFADRVLFRENSYGGLETFYINQLRSKL